jgi:alkyl sulfatase BDS1-like metallo-beta-lactamase superfamily hydrolase
MLFDLMAVRLNPEKVGAGSAIVDLAFSDRKERFRVTVKNDVLTYEADPKAGKADVALTMPRASFLMAALAGGDLKPGLANGTVKAEGDPAAFTKFLSWFDPPAGNFPIVWR